MRKLTLTLILLFFSLSSGADEMVVIANRKNDAHALNLGEIQDIFMGRKRSFPNGKVALPLDQADLRTDFYEKLTNRSIDQINAYWARIMFTGQSSPPSILADDEAVIKTVAENEGAIGYVMKSHLNKNLNVLLILK